MLSGSFYEVNNFQYTGDQLTADISFNAAHEIFKGHFPGMPVVPGVCMMQLIKEMLAQATGTSLRIKAAAQVKFLTVITPKDTPLVQLKLQYKAEDNQYQVQAELLNEKISYFKFKGLLVPAETMAT